MKQFFTQKNCVSVLIALFLFSGISTFAQTYTNAVLSSGATANNGTAAPAGYTWSECQNVTGNTTVANQLAGSSASIAGGFSLADDFIVPAGPSWGVSKVTVYAYSTGYTGTTSPFTDMRLQIRSGASIATSTVVWGNLTTNVLSASSEVNVYRIFNTLVPPTATGTTRKVWKLEANLSTTLAPGTYWIQFQTGTSLTSNFVPVSADPGVRTVAGYNAQQYNGTAWAAVVDDGITQSGTTAGQSVPLDIPFQINYATSGCSGTPTPGNTITSATAVCPGTAFNLSLQNSTSGTGVTYQWQSGASATGPWSNITGATNSTYSVSTLAASTYYQAVVTCGASTGTSTPVLVSLNPASACYCTPSPASDCSDDDVIENVTVGGMSKNSTCAGGYSNYTATDTATIIIGATNPITVTTGDSWTEQVGVWIDYDRSGSFETSEFVNLGSTASGSGGLHSGNIVVPSTVTAGYTRMRVRVRFSTALTGTGACLSYTYGETEDYTVRLAPCVAASITTQPVNRTINCGDNTTFSVVTAGSLPVVYWEYRTSATGTWQNVTAAAPFTYTGANTNTLSLTNASGSLNGYQFRAVYSGACTAVDFSNTVTLTVNPLIATISPVNPTVCTGSTTAINITNTSVSTTSAYISSGTLNTVIPDNNVYGNGDNVGINNTINVTTLPTGAIITGLSVRLNIVHSWVGDLIIVLKSPNGKIYNLDYALTATGGTGATTGFTNTIISSGLNLSALSSGANPWTGTFRPDNQDPAAGDPDVPLGPAGFIPDTRTITDLYAGAGNGGWTLALYDYYDDLTVTNRLVDWAISFTYGAPQTGVFSPTTGLYTNAAGTIAYTGTAVSTVYAAPAASTTYTLVVTNPTCTSSPLSIPVTVSAPLSTVTVPAATAACIGTPKTISSTLGSGLASVVTYAWQVSTDGGTSYTAVANGTAYSGATTANLTITSPTAAMTGYRYRVIASIATCGSSVTSTPTVLTVNARPVLTVSANPYTAIYPGQTTTLAVASSTTAPAAGYQWYRNGVAVSGATANTLVVDIDGLGEYTVDVVDANGCGNAVTPSITISEAQNDILFIYPSPNSGQFQVRYYSQAGNTALPRVLNVYDSKGARVYSKQYSITVPYTRMDVDMSNFSAGIYLVELIDRTGARIKTGRVLIQK
ncbi:MAG: GEVED domain-containing protein [Ferruginibacter sp.]